MTEEAKTSGTSPVFEVPSPVKHDKNPNPAYQYIIVMGFNTEMHFRMKRTASLTKLKTVFVSKVEEAVYDKTRFLFNGLPIADNATPEGIGMPVLTEVIVDAYAIRKLANGLEIPEIEAAGGIIFLTMRDEDRDSVLRVKRTCSFRRIRQRYSQRTGHSTNSTRFRYKGNIVKDEETPESIGMELGKTNNIDVSQVRYGSDGTEIEGGQRSHDDIDLTEPDPFQFESGDTAESRTSVDFRVGYDTQMSIMKQMFAMVSGNDAANLMFGYMGIQLRDSQTPRDLEMDDNDKVNVFKVKNER